MSEKAPHAPWRDCYGRRKGHNLRQGQEVYLAEELDHLSPGMVS